MNEAVENISLIKGVIDRTNKSFIAFSKVFIYWGMLFIVNSIIYFIISSNEDKIFDIVNRFPPLNYIFPVGIITLLATLIYRHISKKMPLIGLEKNLMKVWILVLFMNVMPYKIIINSSELTGMDITKIMIQVNHFSVMLFSLAIALIVTSLFSGYKHLMNLGLVYIGISLLYSILSFPMLEGTLLQLMYSLPLPFTFIYTGLFLKFQQTRRN